MQDYILTAPSEQDLITALPEYRVQSEGSEQWAGNVFAPCTRWITRPQYDEDGELTNTLETVPGFHLILRAESLPEAAQQYIVADPGDIEPIPAGGLMKPTMPYEVTALQGMLAIQAGGMIEGFLAWKNSLDPVNDFAVIAFFEKAQTWNRDNAQLIQGATALGLTEEQLDNLFMLAATL